jgi:ABC-type spermidine/putrescine transport system permease subunit II
MRQQPSINQRVINAVANTLTVAAGAATSGMIGALAATVLALPFIVSRGTVEPFMWCPWWVGAVIGMIAYVMILADSDIDLNERVN